MGGEKWKLPTILGCCPTKKRIAEDHALTSSSSRCFLSCLFFFSISFCFEGVWYFSCFIYAVKQLGGIPPFPGVSRFFPPLSPPQSSSLLLPPSSSPVRPQPSTPLFHVFDETRQFPGNIFRSSSNLCRSWILNRSRMNASRRFRDRST